MRDEARIEANTIVVQSKEPVAVDMDDTVVMMSLAQGKYYGLDRVGSRVWELLARPLSVAEICATLVAEFDVDPDVCDRDVREFLAQLAAERLIRIVNEPADPVRPTPVS